MKLYPLNYLNFSNELTQVNSGIDMEEIAVFFKQMHSYQKDFFFFRQHFFYILDYTKRKYLLLSGSVQHSFGHHPNSILEGGMDYIVDIFQKDDFVVLNNKIFPKVVRVFQNEPQSEHNKFVFDTNYRIRDQDKKLISILQSGSYLTDPVTLLPTFSYGICMNITPFKNDTCMTHVINKFDIETGGYQHYSTNYFFPDQKESNMTKKEIEVLLHLAEGISSKQIADKMKISINTVSNHRENMLKKTNTKNTTELIVFAIRNKII